MTSIYSYVNETLNIVLWRFKVFWGLFYYKISQKTRKENNEYQQNRTKNSVILKFHHLLFWSNMSIKIGISDNRNDIWFVLRNFTAEKNQLHFSKQTLTPAFQFIHTHWRDWIHTWWLLTVFWFISTIFYLTIVHWHLLTKLFKCQSIRKKLIDLESIERSFCCPQK